MGTLRDKILAPHDLPREKVETPEWAPEVPFVWVRGLTSSGRDAWEMSLTVGGANGSRVPNPRLKNIRSNFCVRVIVDDDGELVFSDKDAAVLGEEPSQVIDRIWQVGRRLSGLAIEEENPSSGDLDESISTESPSPSE